MDDWRTSMELHGTARLRMIGVPQWNYTGLLIVDDWRTSMELHGTARLWMIGVPQWNYTGLLDCG